MVSEQFERRFSVRIVGRFELQVVDANLAHESFDCVHQVAQANVAVGNQALTLMELSQMCRVESFIAEDTINREIFDRLELFFLGKLVKHLRADSCRMRPQQVFLRL